MRPPCYLAFAAILITALAGTGCAFFSLPYYGTQAAVANSAFIHLHVDLVDQDGQALDDVKVAVTRHHLEASPFFPGQWSEDRTDAPQTVGRVFDYNLMGSCAVTVTFSKPGFAPETHTYAKVDYIHSSPMPIFGHEYTGYPCENIDKKPPRRIMLKKTAATQG